MFGSNFALLVKSPGDDAQLLLTTVSRYIYISLGRIQFPSSTNESHDIFGQNSLCNVGDWLFQSIIYWVNTVLL